MIDTPQRSVLIVISLLTLAYAHAETLPDPTRPANYSARLLSKEVLPLQLINWDVRAIRTSASGRNAVVNGKLVRIGDTLESATIVDITPATVVINLDRKQLVLRLMPEDIKTRATEPTGPVTEDQR